MLLNVIYFFILFLSYAATPQFTVTPQDQTVLEGQTVDFPCEASGYPTPLIIWTRGGSPLSSDRRNVILASGTLRITRVAAHDEGQYECEAVSLVGTVRTPVQLRIEQRGEKIEKGKIFQELTFKTNTQTCRVATTHIALTAGAIC